MNLKMLVHFFKKLTNNLSLDKSPRKSLPSCSQSKLNSVERLMHPEKDVFAKAYQVNTKNYGKCLEHQAVEFWKNYYEGEHPVCILEHSLVTSQQPRSYNEQKNINDHMLFPDQA